MKKISTALLAAAILGCAGTLSAHAAGQVEVSYIKPDEFRDAGRGSVDRDRTLAALTQYLQRLSRQLPAGRTLRLEVTDLDLAGEIYPNARLNDLRVLRGGADWPHIRMRYTLLEGGRTLKSGEARLSDPGYMFSSRVLAAADSELAYEKRMLKDWFEQTILRGS